MNMREQEADIYCLTTDQQHETKTQRLQCYDDNFAISQKTMLTRNDDTFHTQHIYDADYELQYELQ